MKIAIVGGGAAGFFAAAEIAGQHPNAQINLFEGSNKFMAKVLISGGGRCNVTHREMPPSALVQNYPRGHDFLLPAMQIFHCGHSYHWFEAAGVPLKVEQDGRVFPRSNRSSDIYDCLYRKVERSGVLLHKQQRLKSMELVGKQFKLKFSSMEYNADRLVVCTGSNQAVWELLENKGIPIVAAVPSLFTFQLDETDLVALAGVSVPNASIRLGHGKPQAGAMLITHQGLSGPAVLRLSAWEARKLNKVDYQSTLEVNWNAKWDVDRLAQEVRRLQLQDPKGKVLHWKGHGLPKRLWKLLFNRCGFPAYLNWSEMGKKSISKLGRQLVQCQLQMKGKHTFKEEFVTAGGVDLKRVDPIRFESMDCAGLYFAGEVLNMDAITGGFNFQAAWTSAYLISRSL